MRGPLALVALAAALASACWSGSSRVAAPALPPGTVRTCAIEPLPPRVPQRLIVRRWLGRVGERSWLVAEADRRLVLVALAGQQLALTALPFTTLRADYVAGGRLWLAGTLDDRTLLVEVDLAAAPARVGAVTELDPGPLAQVDAIAISDDRILVAERDPVEHRFQLFERAGGKRLGVLVTVRSGDPVAAKLRCTGERCFAIGIEGDGQSRRAFVVRFAPDGSTENELLAADRVANLQLAQFGERTIAVWTALDRSGLFGRALDPSGRPAGGRVVFEGLRAAPLVFELLPAAPPRIAIRDVYDAWTLATLDVDARRLDDVRPLPLEADIASFTGAVTPDGVAGAGFTSRVDYQVGGHGFHARAFSVFVPEHADAEPAIEILPATRGEGRGGYAAFPLVEPGHTAALVVPQGYEMAEGGDLVLLRRPCP